GAAACVDVADFARRQTKLRVTAVLGNQTNGCSSRTSHLCAAAGAELDSVNHGTGGDVLQREVVARLDVSRCAVLDNIALLQLVRRDDVTLLAVEVVQQRDA